MPELPEVESLRRSLEPHLKGRRLREVGVHAPKLRWDIPKTALHALGRKGAEVVSLRRRGKYLIIDFDHGASVLSHLGMSGQWLVDEPYFPGRHMHLRFVFDGCELIYRDPRRFGMIDVVPTERLFEHPRLCDLGPEPLSSDFGLSALWPSFRTAKQPVKTWLMNAKNVVGVGNIYASEALFLAGIRPTRRCVRVPKYKLERLVECVRDVIATAIDSGGTTLQDYRNADGDVGGFQNRLQVYGREGLPCYACDAKVRRVVLGQRSTFYCPKCQAS